MRKYNLARMLEEIRQDEGGGKGPAKKLLTQEQIKALARKRKSARAKQPAGK